MASSRLPALLVAMGALASSCGYRLVGTANTLPDSLQTIAVPAFENATAELKIEQYLTEAVVQEFLSRTNYRVTSDATNADAALRGTVVLFDAVPLNFDLSTGRATSIMTVTRLHVSLQDTSDGRELYSNPDLTHRETHEVSADPDAYLDEREAALRRASRTMASTLVSAVLSGF